MFCMPVGITVLSCWAENCSLKNWHCKDDIKEHEKLPVRNIQVAFLIHTFYKIIYISFLISIASHICVAWFYFCLPKKRKMRTVGFWHPRYPLVPASKLLCDPLPRSVTSCLLGLQAGGEELQGVFPPSCRVPVGRLFQIEGLAASFPVVLCFSCSAER